MAEVPTAVAPSVEVPLVEVVRSEAAPLVEAARSVEEAVGAPLAVEAEAPAVAEVVGGGRVCFQ